MSMGGYLDFSIIAANFKDTRTSTFIIDEYISSIVLKTLFIYCTFFLYNFITYYHRVSIMV
jgi:hypothetical protein